MITGRTLSYQSYLSWEKICWPSAYVYQNDALKVPNFSNGKFKISSELKCNHVQSETAQSVQKSCDLYHVAENVLEARKKYI